MQLLYCAFHTILSRHFLGDNFCFPFYFQPILTWNHYVSSIFMNSEAKFLLDSTKDTNNFYWPLLWKLLIFYVNVRVHDVDKRAIFLNHSMVVDDIFVIGRRIHKQELPEDNEARRVEGVWGRGQGQRGQNVAWKGFVPRHLCDIYQRCDILDIWVMTNFWNRNANLKT